MGLYLGLSRMGLPFCSVWTDCCECGKPYWPVTCLPELYYPPSLFQFFYQRTESGVKGKLDANLVILLINRSGYIFAGRKIATFLWHCDVVRCEVSKI